MAPQSKHSGYTPPPHSDPEEEKEMDAYAEFGVDEPGSSDDEALLPGKPTAGGPRDKLDEINVRNSKGYALAQKCCQKCKCSVKYCYCSN